MKIFVLSAATIAFAGSAALAQSTPPTATTEHVTTKTVHVQKTTHPTGHHATKRRHHTLRCGCPAHQYRTHHKIAKKTTTTTTKG